MTTIFHRIKLIYYHQIINSKCSVLNSSTVIKSLKKNIWH